MKKKHKPAKREETDVVLAYPLEVSLSQVRGDTSKMIKKFMKKVRKEEVLKAYYERLAFPTTKGQQRREKKSRKAWLEKKRIEKFDKDC